MPTKKTPSARRTIRRARAVDQTRSGQGDESAGGAVEDDAPGAPNNHVSPGAKMPPKDSPNTQTTRPHPTLASPPRRDHARGERRATTGPMPIWIHTAAAAACTGW